MTGGDYDGTLNYAKTTTSSRLMLAVLFSLLSVVMSESVAYGDLLVALKGADTVSGSRNAALRAAKEANGIPRSAQPLRTIKPNTPEGVKLGLDNRNVVLHEYVNSAGKKIHIRLDKPASFGGPGGVGDQGWHFNAGSTLEKLKQHHFFGN